MVVDTNSSRVRRARKTIVELINLKSSAGFVWFALEIKTVNYRIYGTVWCKRAQVQRRKQESMQLIFQVHQWNVILAKCIFVRQNV